MEFETTYVDSEMDQEGFEVSELPRMAKWAYYGLVTSLGLYVVVGGAFRIGKDIFFPNADVGGAPWFVALLIVIWAPGVIGLILANFTVAKYPYLSQVVQFSNETITNPRAFIWRLLGGVLMVLGIVLLPTLLMPESLGLSIATIYMSITLIFAGWYLCFNDREKHVTVATFVDLTFGLGFIFVPLFLPALIFGYFKNRRFQKSLIGISDPIPDSRSERS